MNYNQYIFANRETTRFYFFIKTVSTDRDKDGLSFQLFADQFYRLVLRNDNSQHNIRGVFRR